MLQLVTPATNHSHQGAPVTDKIKTLREKSLTQQLADLQHDNRHLYFVIGALTNAIDQLPQLHRQKILNDLQAKADTAPDDLRDTLHTLLESMGKE